MKSDASPQHFNISPPLKIFIAFVPVNERETCYYLRVYHSMQNLLLAKTFAFLMGLGNRFIPNQDRRVVVTQTPLDSSLAHNGRLIGANRAVSQFRRWHTRLMVKVETGLAEGDFPKNQPPRTN